MAKKTKAKKKAAAPKRNVGKPAAKAKAAAAPSVGPVSPINTGPGRSAAEVGADLVNMFNAQAPDHEIWGKLFAKDSTSIEGHGVNLMFRGRQAVEAKAKDWTAKNIVHGAKAEGPFVGSTGFAVRFTVDTEDRQSGARMTMNEIGVYTVQNGRVIQEEFMYGA